MAAEVEQGELADLFAGALRGDEAVGEIGLVGCLVPGLGAADEHAPQAGPGGAGSSTEGGWSHSRDRRKDGQDRQGDQDQGCDSLFRVHASKH